MSRSNRRDILKLLATAPLAATVTLSPAAAQQAHRHAAGQASGLSGEAANPLFFTPHELETVTLLSDWIIPADDRSPSASQVGVPQFIDFIMADQPRHQTAIRGGLALLDFRSEEQFDRRFKDCSADQQKAMLDAIAFPGQADPTDTHLVAFFNSMRDLTASGFWTTREGMADLQYQGNDFLDKWEGCPEAALKKLGVSYEE